MAADREKPPKRRLRLQFSLRGLLLLVTVFGLWLGWYTDRANRQRQAVAAIRATGGILCYDYEVKGFQNIYRLLRAEYSAGGGDIFLAGERPTDIFEPPGPAWLSRTVGTDYLARVVQADLTKLQASDDAVKYVSGLSSLQDLWLPSRMTDAGLANLEGLARLRILTAVDMQVTDAGLMHIERLTDLRTLRLEGPAITDSGLYHLRKLSELQLLSLNGSHITGPGLEHLNELKKLVDLRLRCTQVDDAGLKYLSGMTNLRSLDLYGTEICNDGLPHLNGLKNLAELDLRATYASPLGAEKLQRQLPNTLIRTWWDE